MSGPNSSTRAQWVVPKRNPSVATSGANVNKENPRPNQRPSVFRNPYHDLSSQASSASVIIAKTYTSDPILNQQRLTQSEHIDLSDQQNRNEIDSAICKTICVIVEQYLKDLRECQKRINQARSNLRAKNHHSSDDCTYIAYNDVFRLRVRDEQTKAVETIKQLTNYLKELSTIRRPESGTAHQVDPEHEGLYDRLSDLRNDIIYTLNDFVLANSDIDMPIVDPDDGTSVGRDYDLCVEAQRSHRGLGAVDIAPQTIDSQAPPSNRAKPDGESYRGSRQGDLSKPSQQLARRPLTDRSSSDANIAGSSNEQSERIDPTLNQDDQYKLVAIQDDYQSVELDKRKREIHKLERDTVELRNLFVDFYQLIKMQGEQVDNIEDNIVAAAQHISEGRDHLEHRPMKGLTVLIPMTGCITGALIGGPIGLMVGGKLGSMTIICATSLVGLLSSLGARKLIKTNQQRTR